jgi:hypothetical protein
MISIEQKYQRIRSELNIKDTVATSEELATPAEVLKESGFDPKALKTAYNFADYDEVFEPPVFDNVDLNLLPPKPERQVKTNFQKMFFSGTKFLGDVIPNVPEDLFSLIPNPGKSS